jgi:hypothetical protein
LVNGVSETSETKYLAKFSILRNGISEKFIPRLSDHCKKEIEGSFKITHDEELRQSTLAPPSSVELSDNDKVLQAIMRNEGEDTQKLINILKDEFTVEGQEPNDPVIEDLTRQVFASMICF